MEDLWLQVLGWHCTIISPPSSRSIGLRQPLSELFIPEKFSLRLVSRFLFYWAHRTRRSQYEARGANCLKTWNCCYQKPFFSPKWRNRPIVEPPGCARTRWGSWDRSPETLAGLNFPEVMPTPELPDNCKIKIKCNARICFDDINICIIVLHNNLYLYVTYENIFIY